MRVIPKATVELKQELTLSVRELLQSRMVDLLDLAEKFGFSLKVGATGSTMVVVNRTNMHFIHPKL